MNIKFQGVLKNQVGTVNGGHLNVEYAPHRAVGGGQKDRSYQGSKERVPACVAMLVVFLCYPLKKTMLFIP